VVASLFGHTSTLSSVILGFGNVSPLGYSTRWR